MKTDSFNKHEISLTFHSSVDWLKFCCVWRGGEEVISQSRAVSKHQTLDDRLYHKFCHHNVTRHTDMCKDHLQSESLWKQKEHIVLDSHSNGKICVKRVKRQNSKTEFLNGIPWRTVSGIETSWVLSSIFFQKGGNIMGGSFFPGPPESVETTQPNRTKTN